MKPHPNVKGTRNKTFLTFAAVPLLVGCLLWSSCQSTRPPDQEGPHSEDSSIDSQIGEIGILRHSLTPPPSEDRDKPLEDLETLEAETARKDLRRSITERLQRTSSSTS